MSALSIGVRSPDEKSLLLLGLIAREFARRTHSLGQAGGGRETRIELSPQPPDKCQLGGRGTRIELSPRSSAGREGEKPEGNLLFGTLSGALPRSREPCSRIKLRAR